MDLWGTLPLVEYGDRLSWNKLFAESLQAQKVSSNPDFYLRIPRVTMLTNSNILQVGCGSVNAKPYWRLGCWLSVAINALPSSTSQFSNWVEIKRWSVPLGKLLLIEWPQYDPQEYRLTIDIPKWIIDLYLEIWWYDGHQGNSLESNIKAIREKIDTL